MNATIDRYATVSLFPFSGKTIEIESIDYGAALKYDVDQFWPMMAISANKRRGQLHEENL